MCPFYTLNSAEYNCLNPTTYYLPPLSLPSTSCEVLFSSIFSYFLICSPIWVAGILIGKRLPSWFLDHVCKMLHWTGFALNCGLHFQSTTTCCVIILVKISDISTHVEWFSHTHLTSIIWLVSFKDALPGCCSARASKSWRYSWCASPVNLNPPDYHDRLFGMDRISRHWSMHHLQHVSWNGILRAIMDTLI